VPKSWTTVMSDRRGSIVKRRMKGLETLEWVLVCVFIYILGEQ